MTSLCFMSQDDSAAGGRGRAEGEFNRPETYDNTR